MPSTEALPPVVKLVFKDRAVIANLNKMLVLEILPDKAYLSLEGDLRYSLNTEQADLVLKVLYSPVAQP